MTNGLNNVEKKNAYKLLVGCKMVKTLWKIVWQFLKKLNIGPVPYTKVEAVSSHTVNHAVQIPDPAHVHAYSKSQQDREKEEKELWPDQPPWVGGSSFSSFSLVSTHDL